MKKSFFILAMALGVIACNREELSVADQNDRKHPMDVEGIRKLLSLSAQQLPVMNNPVGFPAE